MDLKIRESTWKNENHSWLGSAHGTDMGETIELDLSTFDFAAVFTLGFLPSGVAIAKITASGKYGKYDNTLANGRETGVGHLLHSVAVKADNTTGIAIGALFHHGTVVEANLPTGHGVDAAFKVDVAGRIRYRG